MLRIVTAALIAVLAFAAPVLAQNMNEPPIGTLVDVEGNGNLLMRATEDGKAYPAKLNDVVYRNDVVQTGTSGARILLVLIDESRFTLGDNARFKVDEYAYDSHDTAGNNALYSLLQGAFLYTSGFMTKTDSPQVKIETPYGSIGIRGTSIWGGNLGAQYGVYVDEGEVSIETKRGHTRVVAGDATSINSINSIPEKPKPLAPEIIAAAKQTVALKNIDQIKLHMAAASLKHKDMVEAHSQYIHTIRLDQADQSKSVRKRGRGVLKIEQDRQDERKKLWDEENPVIENPMMDGFTKKPASPQDKSDIDDINVPTEPTPPTAPTVKQPNAAPVDTGPAPLKTETAPSPMKKPDPF